MDEQRRKLAILIERVQRLIGDHAEMNQHYEAVALSQTILHETLGDRHPLMQTLNSVIEDYNGSKIDGACRALITLYEQGLLASPRLQVAKELEEDVLDVAERQIKAVERQEDPSQKQLRLAVAAFLCGASLEDTLRRLCEKHGVDYDTANTSISKLQSALYLPAKGIEFISKSENAQISAWGQTRNKADHGHFSELTLTEVQIMIMGVRAFIDKHLP
jgi:hypothetical protein